MRESVQHSAKHVNLLREMSRLHIVVRSSQSVNGSERLPAGCQMISVDGRSERGDPLSGTPRKIAKDGRQLEIYHHIWYRVYTCVTYLLDNRQSLT